MSLFPFFHHKKGRKTSPHTKPKYQSAQGSSPNPLKMKRDDKKKRLQFNFTRDRLGKDGGLVVKIPPQRTFSDERKAIENNKYKQTKKAEKEGKKDKYAFDALWVNEAYFKEVYHNLTHSQLHIEAGARPAIVKQFGGASRVLDDRHNNNDKVIDKDGSKFYKATPAKSSASAADYMDDLDSWADAKFNSLEQAFGGVSSAVSSVSVQSSGASSSAKSLQEASYEASVKASYSASASAARSAMDRQIFKHRESARAKRSYAAMKAKSSQASSASQQASISASISASSTRSLAVSNAKMVLKHAHVDLAASLNDKRIHSYQSALIAAQAKAGMASTLSKSLKRQNDLIAQYRVNESAHHKALSNANHQIGDLRNQLKTTKSHYSAQLEQSRHQLQVVNSKNLAYAHTVQKRNNFMKMSEKTSKALEISRAKNRELKSILHNVLKQNIKADQESKIQQDTIRNLKLAGSKNVDRLQHKLDHYRQLAIGGPITQNNPKTGSDSKNNGQNMSKPVSVRDNPQSGRPVRQNRTPSFVMKDMHLVAEDVSVTGRFGDAAEHRPVRHVDMDPWTKEAHRQEMSRVKKNSRGSWLSDIFTNDKRSNDNPADEYYQPSDVKSDDQGVFVIKDFGPYHYGERLKQVGIVTGKDGVNDFMLTNGHFISANKRYVRLE